MNPILSNALIILFMVFLLALSLKSAISHFKGEGSCCGGGSGIRLIKPQKFDNVIAEKTMTIEGMVCENCAGRVHNALNSIEGISAKVNRSKGQAVIKFGQPVDDEKIIRSVTDLGYKVTEMT
ncbi:MAG: cation transporter [Lachnospiraceae bacterium]|nr:cation transporter [Lachnospiraceae bacterium]